MKNVFDITSFGAKDDGKTDCTKAIQSAIDKAGEVCGTVIIPPGTYMTGQLRMRSSVHLRGYQGWGYRDCGGSILMLCDDKAQCLLDLSYSHACMIEGIQFMGNRFLGDCIHGIMLDYPLQNADPMPEDKYADEIKTHLSYNCHRTFHEDSTIIKECQCKNFSGDGIHLNHMFAFKISDCMIMENAGDGIYANGCDFWVYNNIIAINGGAGIGSVKPDNNGGCAIAASTIINNRIEWNRHCGIETVIADSMQINSNFMDRNAGPAIKLGNILNRDIVINGNIFRRNGAAYINTQTDEIVPFEDKYDSSEIYIQSGTNITINANTFNCGKDDTDGTRPYSPDYTIVYKGLDNCIISGNVMKNGALVQNLADLGQHKGKYIIENNIGCIKEEVQ